MSAAKTSHARRELSENHSSCIYNFIKLLIIWQVRPRAQSRWKPYEKKSRMRSLRVNRLVPSRSKYLGVLWVREDSGLGWGARGARGKPEKGVQHSWKSVLTDGGSLRQKNSKTQRSHDYWPSWVSPDGKYLVLGQDAYIPVQPASKHWWALKLSYLGERMEPRQGATGIH